MEIIDGGIAVDDRGKISFVNDINLKDIKRFYIVENHKSQFVRAWHGHKSEEKYVFVSRGAIIIVLVDMNDPSIEEERYVLSADKPQVLHIPAGKFNGFKTLTADTQVMFFSTATLEESKEDDHRRDSRIMRDLFEVEER